MTKKIPYGISEFKDIIQENYYFVDKTKYIEKLENLNEKYIVHLRPRRFGKSLFISMLEYYYDIKNKEENTKLFDGLYIGNNFTPKQGDYYILKFDFSGIKTIDESKIEEEFILAIRNGLEKFNIDYNLNINILYNSSASGMLSSYITNVQKYIKNKIYVLIDEYDHFANDILGKNYNFFKQSVSSSGFVRTFYEVIKKGTTSIIDRIFITGVSPLTLDSFTSGFNISSDFTRDLMFNEMLGFTKDEVIRMCENVVDNKNFDINEKLGEFKKNYNGYKFAKNAKETVYNSDMILYYLSNYTRYGKEPENIISKNVRNDIKKIESIFYIGGFDNYKIQVLKDLVIDTPIASKLNEQFDLDSRFTITDFISNLFYLGFITNVGVDRANRELLLTPNYVIKELYFDFYNSIIERETNLQIPETRVVDILSPFAFDGDVTPFITFVEEILSKFSNRDFIKFDEKNIKILMLTLLFRSELYMVKSEYEVENGYIDIALFNNSRVHPDYYGIFELKYISKKDYSENLLKEKIEEGKEQILKYTSSDELKSMNNLKKFVIVFSGAECKRIEEID